MFNDILANAIMSSLLYSLNHLIFSHVHFSMCSDLHFLSCRFLCHLPILNKYRLLKVSKLARWLSSVNDICAYIGESATLWHMYLFSRNAVSFAFDVRSLPLIIDTSSRSDVPDNNDKQKAWFGFSRHGRLIWQTVRECMRRCVYARVSECARERESWLFASVPIIYNHKIVEKSNADASFGWQIRVHLPQTRFRFT